MADRPVGQEGKQDAQLLAEFVRKNSQDAFGALVERHTSMVHATCLRGLGGDMHLAEDATQAVFVILAGKAATIRDGACLAGWLFKTANSVVAHVRRAEARRKKREAVWRSEMERKMNEDALREDARTLLNAALGSLRRKQREAVVLYYLADRPQREVARELGCSEEAVKKRISRALVNLRTFLARKEVVVSAGILTTQLTAEGACAAPTGLVTACHAAAMKGIAGGAAATGSPFMIAKGAMKMMVWAKVKLATTICTAVLVAGAGATAVLQGAEPAGKGNEMTEERQDTGTPPSQSATPEWMVVLRAYGSIFYTTKKWGAKEGEKPFPLTPEHIDSWMEDCARHGITTILWRPNCYGAVTYPSKFTGMPGEVPLPEINRGMGLRVKKQYWPASDWQHLAEQCKRFNTLEVAVKAAHRHGLKLYLIFNTFDMVGTWCTRSEWPDGGERAWDPDLWLWSKDQKQRLGGVPSYAEPRVRQLGAAQIAEALEFGIDGVVLDLWSHCAQYAGDQRCNFGYNPIVVEEYKKRHGVDPLTDEVDPHLFYALHGEYFTQFVREASKVVRAKGKKLIGVARTDGVNGWGGAVAGKADAGVMQPGDLRDGKSELPLAGGLYLEWEKWASEGLVDGLLFWSPFEGGLQAVQQLKQKVDVPVYLWRKYMGWKGKFGSPSSLQAYESEIQAVRRGALDGYCLQPLFICRHEWMAPDWRDVLSGQFPPEDRQK